MPECRRVSIHRRELLRQLGGMLAYSWVADLAGCRDATSGAQADTQRAIRTEGPFLHGVASGDPLPDSVVLWTRVTTGDAEHPPDEIDVQWQIARDEAFSSSLRQGVVRTSAARDHTVKVDARGLDSGSTYYYRFRFDSHDSPVGRTRTAPRGTVERLRFAVACCSSYAHGYFHAYRAIARRDDLDAVIHLGDYIYEYGDGEYGAVRPYDPPHEILTLDDYRRRFAHYRRDPDLQAVHLQLPMIAIWDDHEVANNAWQGGAENHDPDAEGDFAVRKAAAMQAYAEWMPIRDQPDGRCFRKFAFGDLLDLLLLDTRLWGRSQQLVGPEDPSFASDERSLLGADQERWFADAMSGSEARWRAIAQQIMVGPMPLFFNADAWAGYPAARRRLLNVLEQHPNSVVLTGDVHSSWVLNLCADPYDSTVYDRETGRGAVAVEFVTPGITSPGLDDATAAAIEPMMRAEPHVGYAQLSRRGYMVIDIDRDRIQATHWHFAAVDAATSPSEQRACVCSVRDGERAYRIEDASSGA